MANNNKQKFVFFLTNKKGHYALRGIIREFNKGIIEFVVTYQDRNVKKDYYDEIISLCKEYDIPYHSKDSYPDYSTYSFAIGWRWIIPKMDKLIVFHDSLLPKYRGFSPLVSALVNGEKEIGVTALFASEKYDEGDIIIQEKLKVEYPVIINEVIEKISSLYSKIILKVIGNIIEKKELKSVSQNHSKSSYSLWRNDDDYNIDWSWDAEKIKRLIDATGFPYKGASARIDDTKYKLLDCDVITDVSIENRTSGKVIFVENGLPVIVCGKGLLKIKQMIRDDNGETALPLKRFRIRFK